MPFMSGKIKITYKNILELKEYENNPRLNDDAVESVKQSIRQFGWKVPIVIDDDNTIITGHTRIRAARELGITDIPCIIASDLSPAQAKAFRLADNKTSEQSGWDFAKLDIELRDLKDIFNMGDFGFIDYDRFDQTPPIPADDGAAEIFEGGPVQSDGKVPHGGGRDDYAVIIHCFDEDDRAALIERMEEEGRSCVRL